MNTDYQFYVESYHGNIISEDDFPRLSQGAEQWIRHFTFGRIPESWEGETWESQAMMAVCRMAEVILREEKRYGKTSENTDGYAISFDTSVNENAKLYGIAYVYLGFTGLMDFGCDDEC